MEQLLTVRRWRRYGADRLFVTQETGAPVGSVDLQSGEVAGYEALARWQHEDRGEISPTEFIPVAEESGLILTLGLRRMR